MSEDVYVGQTYEVESEDGTRLKINLAPKGALREVRTNMSGRMGDGNDATSFIEKKERKIKMYQGASPSWIPVGSFERMLSKGFTPHPTASPRPTPFTCDTVRGDGSVCSKGFVSRLDRLRHIKNAHSDASMFVLTDDEQALLAGDLTAARRIVPKNERNNDEVDINAVIEERARELAEQMVSKMVAEMPAEVGNDVEEFNLPTTSEHTCKSKGRFGRVDPDCAACQLKLKAKEEENGTS